jgi:hypothetical protein
VINRLVLQLDDADYHALKAAADREGKAIDAWVLNAARQALPALPSDSSQEDSNGWPVGFFERTYGSLADDPIERLPQGCPEIREPIA